MEMSLFYKFRNVYYKALQVKRELEKKQDLSVAEKEKLQIMKGVIRSFEEYERAERGYIPWWQTLLMLIPPLFNLYKKYLIWQSFRLQKRYEAKLMESLDEEKGDDAYEAK